ncbi:MAG: lipid II flippase MurJ [Chloroflexaceae bacterium]
MLPDHNPPSPVKEVPTPGARRRYAGLPGPAHRRWSALLLRESGIAEGSFLLMLSFLASAVLGMLRQILFNAQFGISWQASAYYAAFRLPETFALLLTGGTLANAMLPVLVQVAHTEGEAAARRFINLVLTTLLAVMTPLVLLGLLLAPWFVRTLLAPGFDAATAELTTTLTRIMLLELLLLVVVSVGTAVLYSRNQFVLPALGVAVHNLTLIGGILLAWRFPTIGVYGPTIGVITDALLQLLILLPGLPAQKIRYVPVWHPRDQHLHAVFRLLLPSGLSGAVNYAGGIVDVAFASLVSGGGNIPALHNAFLLFGVPVRLLGIAIGQAAFPRLAAQVVDGRWRSMRRTLLRSLGIALGLACLGTLGFILLGRPVIRILFEHGEFDAAAGTLTYTVLVGYALALPAAIGTEILTRSLQALHDTRTPLLINCGQLAGRIALIPLLLPTLGLPAIPVAFALTSTLETAALGGAVWVKLRHKE